MVRHAASDLTLSPLLLLTIAAVAAVLGGLQWRAYRRSGRLGRWRVASLCAALVLLAASFVSPLATMAQAYLLTAHLVQVTLVMGVVPPLLLLAVPRPLPVSRAPRWLRVAGTVVVHPACSIVLVNLVFFGWHAPALYDASLAQPEVYSLQQLTLLLVSLAFWWAIVEPTGAGPWSMSGFVKLGYILLATIPQTFAGLLFALAHRVFYAGYLAAPRVVGMSAMSDQQVAGACMAVLSKLALFAAFSVVLWRLLASEGYEDEPGDDGGNRRDDDDRPRPVPSGTPAWLQLLNRGRLRDEPAPRRRPVAPRA